MPRSELEESDYLAPCLHATNRAGLLHKQCNINLVVNVNNDVVDPHVEAYRQLRQSRALADSMSDEELQSLLLRCKNSSYLLCCSQPALPLYNWIAAMYCCRSLTSR